METVMVKTEVAITQQRVEDLLCGAFEGGSNYWAYFVVSKKQKQGVKIDYIYEIATRGGEITINDRETGETLGFLNEESIKKGLQLMAEKYPNRFIDVVNENDDADTADIFVQLAVMGELVFG